MYDKKTAEYVILMLEELGQRGVIDLKNVNLEQLSNDVIDKLKTESLERYAKSGGDFGPYGVALWSPLLLIGLGFGFLKLKSILTNKFYK